MKRILITGENSYIGTSFKSYISGNFEGYQIDELDVKDDNWRKISFSNYDVVFHVAGIAHIKETKDNEALYYKVNRDLAIDIAAKAKKDSVNQFIFLSSMSVYGLDQGAIDENTIINPKSAYGKSKLEAEIEIKKLQSDTFLVSILRPPMVYGPNCKGNYPKLSKLAKITPIFPYYKNKRSMIYIDNLSIFIKDLIDHKKEGLFLPQNNEYVVTHELVKEISLIHNKKILFTKIFNPFIKLLMNVPTINKVFGNLYYIHKDEFENFIDFQKTLSATERINER